MESVSSFGTNINVGVNSVTTVRGNVNDLDWVKCRAAGVRTWAAQPGAQPRQKSWGDQGLGLNTGALAPRARPKAGLGVVCGKGSPPPALRARRYHLRKIFWKTQMLNTAFWWLLAVKVLASWKLRPRSWGTNTLLVPYGCAYVHNELWVSIPLTDWTWLKGCVKENVTNISKLPAASAEKTPRRIKTPIYLHMYIGRCIDLQA